MVWTLYPIHSNSISIRAHSVILYGIWMCATVVVRSLAHGTCIAAHVRHMCVGGRCWPNTVFGANIDLPWIRPNRIIYSRWSFSKMFLDWSAALAMPSWQKCLVYHCLNTIFVTFAEKHHAKHISQKKYHQRYIDILSTLQDSSHNVYLSISRTMKTTYSLKFNNKDTLGSFQYCRIKALLYILVFSGS